MLFGIQTVVQFLFRYTPLLGLSACGEASQAGQAHAWGTIDLELTLGANKLQSLVCRCECLFGSAAVRLNRDISGYSVFCHECTSSALFLWSAAISEEASHSWVFRNEAVSALFQKYTLYLGVIKGSCILPAEPAHNQAGWEMQELRCRWPRSTGFHLKLPSFWE